MALTLTAEINGQDISAGQSYAYLYEPLRVNIEDSDLTAVKVYMDLQVWDISDSTQVEEIVKYAEFDINSGSSFAVDVMEIIRQHYDARVYKYSHIDEIAEDTKGWHSIVSKYSYICRFYNNVNELAKTGVNTHVIIGGRKFPNFVPAVPYTQNLTEYEVVGIDSEMKGRWNGWPNIQAQLVDLSIGTDDRPTVSTFTPVSGDEACGGMVIWKSRLGGYMFWGFDIASETEQSRYKGSLEVGMFESTEETNGDAYVPVDYLEIETSYTINLKSIGLSRDELTAVRGIRNSPAVYYMREKTGELELMRLTSVSAPLPSNANGGDFSITLKSISRTSHKTV